MIIPGNGGADMSEMWYLHAKQELEKLGLKVIAKNMPDSDLARKQFWLPFIEKQLENDEDSILIGHSSGAVAALRYGETHRLEGIVLVSACHTDLGDKKEKASGYFDEPWQWDKIKKDVKWIVQFASKDDSFVPIDEARFIVEQLSPEYHEYSDRGHFMGETEFPELIEAIKRKMKR